MLWLYRLLFVPALVVLAPGYLLRMRRRGGYGENFGQRFGAVPPLPAINPKRPRVWLQAVSVGEMLAVGPIVEALHRDGVDVYLTTTTSTGYRVASDRYRAWVVGIGYFPIDWFPFVRRAWRQIRPDLLILAEGERWPEHLRMASRQGVPVIAMNARLSDRSFARMKTLGAARRLMFDGVTRLLVASHEDELRFLQLGVPKERLVTTGNIKLDVDIPRLGADELAGLRKSLGLPEGPVVLG
ncbi:MAG: 3-deoxy-D-manno-octulosonic acid transferase, partial [Opitutaceae bacterium]